ncbi:hypothetical protein VaNZ11_001836 [Volvox africanus]|uniref:Uncharacterized protein n=1 Tax=Volvox africanus TaxID=51714 RepID=A0ABQ5RRH9_9CHLO|nr:hypothetical protein VaNZ11_001836 [Volvox africanus]
MRQLGMDGIRMKSSGQCAPDGHATGLLGLPAVLGRLSDPSHRCQGPELTCLLQALCKQLISAASNTNLVIFTSADRARTTAAQVAAADVAIELSIGAPERCILPSPPQPFSSGTTSSSLHLRTHLDAIEAPASSQTIPSAAASTNSTPLALPSSQIHLSRAAAAAAAAASRRPPAGPGKAATTSTVPLAPNPTGPLALQPAIGSTNAAQAAAAAAVGLSPAAKDPTEGLAGDVTAGVVLLVDHLEHFHYRAKAVVLDGLLALSAVGLGPDRRLDPAGIASLPLPAGGGVNGAASSAVAAAAAAMAVAAAAGGGGAAGSSHSIEDPAAVAAAVQALGGLGLGDWLALRIISAGAVPRLLEMLTQRTGMNFVPVRQLASQVIHNLARRRNAAVRTALARWRPLPGLISALDVVLEDSPDIAARLLLVLSDLFPITCHQIAGALHKLISKQQPADQAAAAAPPGGGNGQTPVAAAPPPTTPLEQQQQEAVAAEGVKGGTGRARAGAGALAAAEAVATKGRRAKTGASGAEPAATAAAASRAGGGGGAHTALAGGNGAAGRPRRGVAMARNPLPEPAVAPAAVAPVAPPAQAAAAGESATTAHLGLAPDVDVPLEALLMRVTGYYMRLSYNAVLSPAPLPQPAGIKPPYGEAERRECEKALLAQKVEEHRRRRKEAAQLDCCVAALLAAAPMPSCLFDALSYSHTRAFSVLVGPPPSMGLTGTTNGGLWRAQDLLPYTLNLIQSLGGGSDSGDGGNAAAAVHGLGMASASAAATGAAATTTALPGNALAGSLKYSGSIPIVAAALDRFWDLEHPRHVVSGSSAGGAAAECPGPAFPSAPYGDKPVSTALLEHCDPILRVVLERAIQAADSLPVIATPAAVSAETAVAAPAPPPAAAELLAARVEAVPLAVLRSVGMTFLFITRSQVALRLMCFMDCLTRLMTALARHTDGAAAGVAQARMALGLANLWLCAGGGAACSGYRRQQRDDCKTANGGGGAAPAVPVAALKDTVVEPVAAVGAGKCAAEEKQAEPQLRRSARIKRRRDGAAAAAAAAAGRKEALTPPSQSGGDSDSAVAASVAGAAAGFDAAREPKYSELLESMVSMLTVRFADARHLQDSLDFQLRQQQEQHRRPDGGADGGSAAPGTSSALAGPLTAAAAAAASGAAGAWLAAVSAAASAATAVTPAERYKLVLETQAVLLQAVALLLPAMDAAQASRLVEAGAVHAAARLCRAAATAVSVPLPAEAPSSTSDTPANTTSTTATTTVNITVAAVAAKGSGDVDGQWSEEPLHGVTAVQALGLGLELLCVSGAGVYGCGAFSQVDALAAFGGVLLLRSPVTAAAAAAAAAGELTRSHHQPLKLPPAAAAPWTSPTLQLDVGPNGVRKSDIESEGPIAKSWELLRLMSGGEAPCAGHSVVLQLLGPLVSLTHGSSARCAAARAALMDVLLRVLRWGHSTTQRRRMLLQAMALWGPHLRPLLLRLPRIASPSPALYTAVPRPAPAVDAPLGLVVAAATAAVVETKAVCNLAFGRTNSQSTMPYHGSRTGRVGTPINSTHGPLHAAGIPAQLGQRTPPWGSGAAAAAAGSGSAAGSAAVALASQVMSPTRHFTSASGLRTAVPAAPNLGRGRRGSRLAAGLSSPLPMQAPQGVGFNGGGDVDAGPVTAAAAVMGSTTGVDNINGPHTNQVTLEALCELLEGTMERLADCEVVRHLHATGWLRVLCHGALCTDTAVRESCLRSLTFASRVVGSLAAVVPGLGAGSTRPLPPLLVELEADPELRNQLAALDPAAAAVLLARRPEALPPCGTDSGVMPRLLAAAAAAAGTRPKGLITASTGEAGLGPSHIGSGVAVRPGESPPEVAAVKNGGGAEVGSLQLQLPVDLELVLPVPSPEEKQRPSARRGRRRGAASSTAAKAGNRARKGKRAATRATAAATDATVVVPTAAAAAAEEVEVKVVGAPDVATAASRRTRPRKSAATRRVHAPAVVADDGAAAASLEPPAHEATATLAVVPSLAAAVVVAGPGLLASPVPKRRRISEVGGFEVSEHQCSVGATAPAAAAAGVATEAQQQPTLFPSIGGPSPCTTSLKAASQLPSDVSGRSGSAIFGSSSVMPVPINAAAVASAASAAAVGCTNEPVTATVPASAGRFVLPASAPLELQLTEREQTLAVATRNACMALESALAVRRHDLAALHTADQAAAAAAAAAATMAAAMTAEPQVVAVAAEDAAAATQCAKKKVGRPRAVAMSSTGTRGKQAAAVVPPPSPPAATVAAPPVPAAAVLPTQPIAVADDVFLSHTYRGVSKRLNFDDL